MDQSQLKWIADLVAGQVDVRAWAPGPDDVVADEDLATQAGTDENDGTPDAVEVKDE